MAVTDKAGNDLHAQSTQEILNQTQDQTFRVIATEGLGYDGQTLQRLQADALAQKVTEVGSVTYVGIAAPGTAQATAKWQCKKVDQTTGTVVTWADGDSNFDNVVTDLTILNYL